MAIDKSTLTPFQRNLRMNIRNFLLVATPEQLKRELEISRESGDTFRAECIQELIDEDGK